MISSIVPLLVTLHLPPPEMASFFPNLSPFSNRITFAPCSLAAMVAMSPAGPPPITITSAFISSPAFFWKNTSLYQSIKKHEMQFVLLILIFPKQLVKGDALFNWAAICYSRRK